MNAARASLLCTAAALLALAAGASCSRDDPAGDKPRTTVMVGGGRTAPPPPPAPVVQASPAATEQLVDDRKPAPHVMISSSDAGPLTYTVTTRRDAAPPPVDPDLAVIASGRASAAACFTGIRDGSPSRSASIHVTVLPSGTVNHSEVSSANTAEPWVVSCLESVGNGLHFADKPASDIRTFSIDVTVTRTH
jgi:hypothetical protein